MSEYLIINDNYKFQEFDLDILDIVSFVPEAKDLIEVMNFSFHNTIFTNHWERIESSFSPVGGFPNADIPDICRWIGATLVLSKKAHETLKEILQPYGEFLPVVCGDEIYHIYNCLTEVDVNESESHRIMNGEDIVEVKKIAFDKASINTKLVFKTKFNLCLDIFCTEQLKYAVEKSGLTGVIFSENLTQIGH